MPRLQKPDKSVTEPQTYKDLLSASGWEWEVVAGTVTSLEIQVPSRDIPILATVTQLLTIVHFLYVYG
jgi:hypothetical protein